MTYCSNCGTKIEGDDLFCPNCGGKINGTSSDNNHNQSWEQPFQPIKAITKQINFAEIINTLKTSAINPVSGGKEFIAKIDKNEVIIITVILALFQGILGIWRFNEIISNVQNILSNLIENVSSLATLFGQSSSNTFNSGELDTLNKSINQFKSLITVPYGKIFIQNCILYLIAIFILFIFIYLGTSIFTKVKCTPLVIFKTVLISTLPILTCEIISILLSYISLYIGIAFIVLGALLAISTLTIIVKETLQIKENLCVVIVSISILIALVAFFMTFQNFCSSDLSDIVKSTINSYNNSPFKY